MIIKMETEQVRSLVRRLENLSGQIDQSIQNLSHNIGVIAWQGSSREEFISNMLICRKKINSYCDEMNLLAIRLSDEINQWEQVDNDNTVYNIYENNFITQSFKDFFGSFGLLPYAIGKLFKKEIDNTIDFFERNPKGKALLEDTINANIRFEFINDEGEKEYFGAMDGETIPISWVNASELSEGAAGGYYNGPPPRIMLDEKLKTMSAYQLRETIAHEMQHAIDYESGRVNLEKRNRPYIELGKGQFYRMSNDDIQDYNWHSLEEAFEASYSERVKTEIVAHARGYELNPLKQTGEGVVNMDNVYTGEEYKVILKDRGYSDFYIKDIEDAFSSQGMNVEVDVYWDDLNGCIQVDILDVEKITEIYA